MTQPCQHKQLQPRAPSLLCHLLWAAACGTSTDPCWWPLLNGVAVSMFSTRLRPGHPGQGPLHEVHGLVAPCASSVGLKTSQDPQRGVSRRWCTEKTPLLMDTARHRLPLPAQLGFWSPTDNVLEQSLVLCAFPIGKGFPQNFVFGQPQHQMGEQRRTTYACGLLKAFCFQVLT